MDSSEQSTGKFNLYSENVELLQEVLKGDEFEYHDIPNEYNSTKLFPTVVIESLCSERIIYEIR